MSGKTNGTSQPTPVVPGQSSVDNTAVSEIPSSLDVNPPMSQEDPEIIIPDVEESQQDDPVASDDVDDGPGEENDDDDDDNIDFYQMEFLSDGTINSTGAAPSPMALRLASLVTGFLANGGVAGYGGPPVPAADAASSSGPSKGTGKRNAKAAPRSKKNKASHKKK